MLVPRAPSDMRCGCAAPLLAHVNLLLTLYGGACLATAARLKWDPSTYIALRELLPTEYRALAAATTAGGAALLLLAHLSVAALHASSRRTSRLLLYLYAALMTVVMVCEVVGAAWLALRMLDWLGSDAALQLREALELRKLVQPLLKFLSRWFPLPKHLEALIKEAEEDAPRNLYVIGAAGFVLALLQPLATGLALCTARARSHPLPHSAALVEHAYSSPEPPTTPLLSGEKAQLRTAYKNGRIVVVSPPPLPPRS
ncbi:uncharacterized protein LOC142976133 isoform X2 [Anticarsia gemmatalis]|uniref:uncharacterized protein LOC142976133 isoform X2 n=1 Tax=Anticarsia gemmatalis TaxID=129554 RepID=UPI003F772997